MQHFIKKDQIKNLQLIAMTWTRISYQSSDSQSSTVCGWPSWTLNWPLSASWQNLHSSFHRWPFSILSAVFYCRRAVLALGLFFHHQQLFTLSHSLNLFCISCHHHPDNASESCHCLHSSLFPIPTPGRTQWWRDKVLRAMLQHRKKVVKGRKCRNQEMTAT